MKTSKYLATAIFATASAQQYCTTSTCTLNCIDIDYNIQRCNFNYAPYDNILSCICRDISGIKANTGKLNSCVACNQDGLGSSTLAQYQILAAACDLYSDSGEAAAVSLVASPSATVIALFSSSYLPEIRAAQCSATVTSAGSVSSVTSVPSGTSSTVESSGVPSVVSTSVSSALSASATAPSTQQTTTVAQQTTATTTSSMGMAAGLQQESVLANILIAACALLGLI